MQPGADVVFRKLGETAVIVHLGTNDIFELNDTGVRVWELLSQRVSRDDLVATLVAEFAVDESTARRDSTQLIEEFERRGLLVAS